MNSAAPLRTNDTSPPYSIIEWFKTQRRRPQMGAVGPRTLSIWINLNEMPENYLTVWGDGTPLRFVSLKDQIRSFSGSEWANVRVGLTDAEIQTVAKGACSPGRVSCFLGKSSYYLGSCAVAPKSEATADLLRLLKESVAYNDWNLSYVFVDGLKIYVGGWAAYPDSNVLPIVRIQDRQASVEKIRNLHTADRYWFLPGSDWFGFLATAELPEIPGWLKMDVEFSGAPDASRFARWQRLGPRSELGVLPPDENIRRVSGAAADQSRYLNTGYTEYQTLRSIFAKHGTLFEDGATRILDWGCGCARVTRHALDLPGGSGRVFGVDIDANNVAWCDNNLAKGNFFQVGLLPPMPFDGETFDAVFAVSVLSHLREDDADAWLAEVSRVLRPGGLAVLTYNGMPSAAVHLSKEPDKVEALSRDGFLDYRRSDNLDGHISDREYYRLVFYSDRHAVSRFGRHFEVTALEPCCLAGGQTAAVLRKR